MVLMMMYLKCSKLIPILQLKYCTLSIKLVITSIFYGLLATFHTGF